MVKNTYTYSYANNKYLVWVPIVYVANEKKNFKFQTKYLCILILLNFMILMFFFQQLENLMCGETGYWVIELKKVLLSL